MRLFAAPTSKWLFVPRFPRRSPETISVWILAILRGHNSLLRPPIGRGLKQTFSSHWELSNSVSHLTCTHRGRVDYRLLMVESQIANLTPDHSFCYNLCYKCPNGSCKPIFDIYILIAFQWYKKHPNVRCFDPCNRTLKF